MQRLILDTSCHGGRDGKGSGFGGGGGGFGGGGLHQEHDGDVNEILVSACVCGRGGGDVSSYFEHILISAVSSSLAELC